MEGGAIVSVLLGERGLGTVRDLEGGGGMGGS